MKRSDFEHGIYNVKRFSTLREMVDEAASSAGEAAAYKYRNGSGIETVTFLEFKNLISHLGAAIDELGMADKHINIIGENSFKWILTYLTSLLSEGVCCPVDKELDAAGIVNVVNGSDGEIVFYSKKYEDIFYENRDKFPNIKYFVGFDRSEDDGAFLSFDRLIERGKERFERGESRFEEMNTPDDGLKMLVYTSGTTGIAKGVMLSHHNLVSSVYYGMQVSNIYTTGLSVLPYNHVYEAVCGILVAIHSHATLCINGSLMQIQKNLMLFKPDYIYLVPAIVDMFYKKIQSTVEKSGKAAALKRMMAFSAFMRKLGIDLRGILFKSVRAAFGGNLIKIVCGGAPMRAEVGDFFDSIGIVLTNGYGITECSPLVSVNHADKSNDCTTVGKKLPCVEIKFENLTDDGDGEICVKGDIVMMGYYKQPELTAEVLRDGWFYTGDYGRYNDKGLLMITGRKKNIIILPNGKNIFPEEIENFIQEIPYVKEVVVYASKDGDGFDSSICAQVYPDFELLGEMPRSELEKKLKADIKTACAGLPVYKRVESVTVRDIEFEKTTANKIKRDSLMI